MGAALEYAARQGSPATEQDRLIAFAPIRAAGG
jgi:hypothetical protein